ncbi:purine-nucleoside phosphorylase [Niabella insulamsoli]|uniref:purine-nucleoside phosphorylase n=1 Tax=Niabella insulamsoli TaxID=3144874 RepID=UPI0031FC0178
MNDDIVRKVKETAAYLKSQYESQAKVAIILGSGLGNFVQKINVEKEIPYTDIPHFPVSTVKGHSGKMLFGDLSGKKVVALSGRFHFYEGYTPEEVVFPVRVLKMLGVQTLLLSNAAGGVNEAFNVGDIMIINDHISFSAPNPLIGKNIDEWGTRFPDMSEPYKKGLIAKAQQIGARADMKLHEGVYFVVTGPTFETRAEYRLIKIVGADAVGMSTVQECIVANHMGMDVFAVSVITDLGIREEENVITHEEVLEAAHAAEPKLAYLFSELIKEL